MKTAAWRAHAIGLETSSSMWNWLSDRDSLTARLSAACGVFRVRRLSQGVAVCLADEAAALGLARRRRVRERDVLLSCDDRPVVFAHTVMPLSASRDDWPFFDTLGNRPIGQWLFSDPAISAGEFEYARLDGRHALMQRAGRALNAVAKLKTPQASEASEAPGASGHVGGRAVAPVTAYARRRLFRRRAGVLLVTEVFLWPAGSAPGDSPA